jgi:hypothetical protein
MHSQDDRSARGITYSRVPTCVTVLRSLRVDLLSEELARRAAIIPEFGMIAARLSKQGLFSS